MNRKSTSFIQYISFLCVTGALFFALVSCDQKGNTSRQGNLVVEQATERSALSKNLRVIAITDFHGALDANVLESKKKVQVLQGGAELFSSYIKILKDESPYPVVLVDAGDLFQGTLVSNLYEGRPVVDFYNYLGVDAAALGNHEFDFGPTGKESVWKPEWKDRPDMDPRGALIDRSRQAQFPFLAANVLLEDGTRPDWVKPSILLDVDGVKVGIVGAATEGTPHSTVRANLVGLNFFDPIDLIEGEAVELRKNGADFVILTAHFGGGCGDNSLVSIDDLTSCSTDSELFDVLSKLPSGLFDVAVGGHTHQGILKRFKDTAVMQAFSKGQYVMWTDLSLSKSESETKRVQKFYEGAEVCSHYVTTRKGKETCDKGALLDIDQVPQEAKFLGQNILPDLNVQLQLAQDREAVERMKNKKIGAITQGTFKRNYTFENALGNLFADLMMVSLKSTPLDIAPVDVAMTNNGGLRANLDAKELTFGDIFGVMPFDNKLAIIEITGKQFIRLMEAGIEETRGGYSWSSELVFEADHCRVTQAWLNGEEIQADRNYRIATNDYLAGGGSGMSTIDLKKEQVELRDDAPLLRDLAIEALGTVGELDPGHYYKKDREQRRQRIKRRCSDH